MERPPIVIRIQDEDVEIQRYINEGGYGQVFSGLRRGRETDENFKVAIKVIESDPGVAESRRKSLADEYMSCCKVTGSEDLDDEVRRRIVAPLQYEWKRDVVAYNKASRTVVATTKRDWQLVVAYPLVEGKELFDVVTATGCGPIPERTSQSLMHKTVESMAACHAVGVAHRDLKLDNIMVSVEDCDVRIIDFGMAADVDATGGIRTTKGGTSSYNSPDRHGRVARLPPGEYDAYKGDVWALGASLFAMMTGVLPYDTERGGDKFFSDQRRDCGTYAAISRGDWRSFWAHHAGIVRRLEGDTEGFKQVIEGMLAWDPRERWSMQQVLEHDWIAEGQDVPSDELAVELARRFPDICTTLRAAVAHASAPMVDGSSPSGSAEVSTGDARGPEPTGPSSGAAAGGGGGEVESGTDALRGVRGAPTPSTSTTQLSPSDAASADSAAAADPVLAILAGWELDMLPHVIVSGCSAAALCQAFAAAVTRLSSARLAVDGERGAVETSGSTDAGETATETIGARASRVQLVAMRVGSKGDAEGSMSLLSMCPEETRCDFEVVHFEGWASAVGSQPGLGLAIVARDLDGSGGGALVRRAMDELRTMI